MDSLRVGAVGSVSTLQTTLVFVLTTALVGAGGPDAVAGYGNGRASSICSSREEPLLRLATETLEGLGYVPVPFASSTAALVPFRADPQRFDAVLTDERMPGMSGSALIRELRGIRDAIPVVLMSGYLGTQSVDADVVVRKPLSARELAPSMARALHP